MTLQLLWFEYCDKCEESGNISYQLTQFKKYYRDFVAQTKATMHINRRPGELLEVDWAGQTSGIIDTDTGEVIQTYIFVAALPYSAYAYVEAFLSLRYMAVVGDIAPRCKEVHYYKKPYGRESGITYRLVWVKPLRAKVEIGKEAGYVVDAPVNTL